MAEAYFLRLAGAEPAPKRMVRESCVALSSARMTRGAEPAPKRTRRESAIFLEGLRTTGFLDMDISPRSFGRAANAARRSLAQKNLRFIKRPCTVNNERFCPRRRSPARAMAVVRRSEE